ncbi:hypothetical protein [Nocardia salmonicida]|uniref:hypothetical protein n=1 Tax=Nocardia salmonicida TaxID=53431 RepID=UPI0036355499
MEQSRRPCHLDTRFVQPGENHAWHETADAAAAIEICETSCPISEVIGCARRALSAGNLTGVGVRATRPASGVIAAGIVCRGSAATTAALEKVIATYDRTTGPACRGCQRQLVDAGIPLVEGQAHKAARGLCKGCYSATGRAGALAPVYRLRTPGMPCAGCERPTVGRHATTVPAGHARYAANGLCLRCDSQARRNARRERVA